MFRLTMNICKKFQSKNNKSNNQVLSEWSVWCKNAQSWPRREPCQRHSSAFQWVVTRSCQSLWNNHITQLKISILQGIHSWNSGKYTWISKRDHRTALSNQFLKLKKEWNLLLIFKWIHICKKQQNRRQKHLLRKNQSPKEPDRNRVGLGRDLLMRRSGLTSLRVCPQMSQEQVKNTRKLFENPNFAMR